MYLHEMYKNCVEMSRFTSNKFLVISCVLGFLLQMNIMLDQDCILMMFFVIHVIILWLAYYTSSP
jgi:predicted RND superfamily exporter protein